MVQIRFTGNLRLTMVGMVGALAATPLLAGAARADGATARCEAAKLKVAGLYAACRLKAESKAVKQGGTPDFSKCDAKYALRWESAESAGGGLCPSNGDEASMRTFIGQHTDDVAAALAGGSLPDCAGDLATCEGDLGTCAGDLGTCNGSLGTCNGNLGTCTSDLGTCNGNFGTCTGDLGACNGNLTTCSGDLTNCNSVLATVQDALSSCYGALSGCTGNYANCSANLATVNAGTAVPADVLAGKTFSSGAGLGMTGTRLP